MVGKIPVFDNGRINVYSIDEMNYSNEYRTLVDIQNNNTTRSVENTYRKVSYSDAKQLADSWGIEYIETSAKTGAGVKELFQTIANKEYELPDQHLLLTHHKEKKTIKTAFKPKEFEHTNSANLSVLCAPVEI